MNAFDIKNAVMLEFFPPHSKKKQKKNTEVVLQNKFIKCFGWGWSVCNENKTLEWEAILKMEVPSILTSGKVNKMCFAHGTNKSTCWVFTPEIQLIVMIPEKVVASNEQEKQPIRTPLTISK